MNYIRLTTKVTILNSRQYDFAQIGKKDDNNNNNNKTTKQNSKSYKALVTPRLTRA